MGRVEKATADSEYLNQGREAANASQRREVVVIGNDGSHALLGTLARNVGHLSYSLA